MEQLAIFGGTPVRETPIYYGRQFIDTDDIEAVVGEKIAHQIINSREGNVHIQAGGGGVYGKLTVG